MYSADLCDCNQLSILFSNFSQVPIKCWLSNLKIQKIFQRICRTDWIMYQFRKLKSCLLWTWTINPINFYTQTVAILFYFQSSITGGYTLQNLKYERTITTFDPWVVNKVKRIPHESVLNSYLIFNISITDCSPWAE